MISDVKKLTYAEKVRLLMAEKYWGNNSIGGKIYSFVVADGPIRFYPFHYSKRGGGYSRDTSAAQSYAHTGSPKLQ